MVTTGPVGPPPKHYRPPGVPAGANVGWTPTQPLGNRRPDPQIGPSRASGPSGTGGPPNWRRLLLIASVVAVVALVGTAIGLGVSNLSGDEPALGTTTTRPPGNTVPQTPTVPPSTNIPIVTVGTYESPIRVGQGYVVGLYTVIVLGSMRDAEAAVLSESAVNSPPGSDERVVLVQLQITYNERDGLGNPAVLPFRLSDGARSWESFSASCLVVPDAFQQRRLLGPGESVTGNLCFTIPDDVDDLYLVTDSFAGDLVFEVP